MLPLADRLRFMIFVAVFCFLVTAALLFLDISHVIYILPLNWTKLVSKISRNTCDLELKYETFMRLFKCAYRGNAVTCNRTYYFL